MKADRDALIDAMIENPILIERPVVVKEGKLLAARLKTSLYFRHDAFRGIR